MPGLLSRLWACVDRRRVEVEVRSFLTKLATESLDEWDDAAAWRRLVTRIGKDQVHELITIALKRGLDKLDAELNG